MIEITKGSVVQRDKEMFLCGRRSVIRKSCMAVCVCVCVEGYNVCFWFRGRGEVNTSVRLMEEKRGMEGKKGGVKWFE